MRLLLLRISHVLFELCPVDALLRRSLSTWMRDRTVLGAWVLRAGVLPRVRPSLRAWITTASCVEMLLESDLLAFYLEAVGRLVDIS